MDSINGDFEHQPRPASVRDYKIAASAQNEQRQLSLRSMGNSLFHIVFAFRVDEIPGRAAYLEGGERCQRNVLMDLHRGAGSRLSQTGKMHHGDITTG